MFTRLRRAVVLLLAAASLAAPSVVSAQDYEVWTYRRELSQFRVFDPQGQLLRTIPFAWSREIQFIVAPDHSAVYFAWGTNGHDNQTWKLDLATGATTFLFNNPWAVLTGFSPGSTTRFLSSGSYGEIWEFDTVSGQLGVWQDNDQLPGQFSFDTFRYELSFTTAGKALVKAGYAAAGGDALFLADVCNQDATHHLCNLTVFSNPGGGSTSWANTAGRSTIDPLGRYAFYHTSTTSQGTRRWRRNLSTGAETEIPAALTEDLASNVVFGDQYLFTAALPGSADRVVRACDVHSLVCRVVTSGGPSMTVIQVVPPLDRAPEADAGDDFSVNEGDVVSLDGRRSRDLDGQPIQYTWRQVSDASPIVALTGEQTATPSFNAPFVSVGGETLTFELTVTAGGKTDTDTVSVTVVNVNHAPVADAGADLVVIEGAPATLDGSASFDVDNDTFTYTWVQRSGPAVVLTGSTSARPTFTAPFAGTGGAPGIVATLEFELLVDDGFTADAPAPGYGVADVRDVVVVNVTNVNNPPVASAGLDQTVNEQAAVMLNAGASADPDTDALAYSWAQVGGTPVTLIGVDTLTPSFVAPFVPPGGAALTFQVTVSDGNGGTASDTVTVNVQNVNDPPLASGARPSVAVLWPPNHQMVSVAILGVTDPNADATITITSVTQDEPTQGLGDGDTAIDAVINTDGTVLLRAERAGNGDGRVYRITFTASDAEGSSSGSVTVSVPHNPKRPAIDSGQSYSSSQ